MRVFFHLVDSRTKCNVDQPKRAAEVKERLEAAVHPSVARADLNKSS